MIKSKEVLLGKKKKSLKEKFEKLANKYVQKFEEKHGYEFDCWVGQEVGVLASFIKQYYFNLDDIRYDIDNKLSAEEGLIFKWQDDGVAYNSYTDGTDDYKSINFCSYAKGLRFEDLDEGGSFCGHPYEKDAKIDIAKASPDVDIDKIIKDYSNRINKNSKKAQVITDDDWFLRAHLYEEPLKKIVDKSYEGGVKEMLRDFEGGLIFDTNKGFSFANKK